MHAAAIPAILLPRGLERLQVNVHAYPRVERSFVVVVSVCLDGGPGDHARAVRTLGGGRIERSASSRRSLQHADLAFSLTSVSGFLSVDAPEPMRARSNLQSGAAPGLDEVQAAPNAKSLQADP